MPAIAGIANRKKHVSYRKLVGEGPGAIKASLFGNKPVSENLGSSRWDKCPRPVKTRWFKRG